MVRASVAVLGQMKALWFLVSDVGAGNTQKSECAKRQRSGASIAQWYKLKTNLTEGTQRAVVSICDPFSVVH